MSRLSQARAAVRPALKARALLSGAPGAGKALAIEEVVQTPDGERPIGTLQVGDLVLCPDGTAVPVLGVYPQGVQPLYRIQFSGGAEVRATADHLWVTQTANDRNARGKRAGISYRRPRPGTTRTTAEIAETLTRPDGGHNHTLRPVEAYDGPSPLLPIDPWALGALIGDGSMSGAGVAFTNPDQPVVDRLQESFPLRRSRTQEINYSVTGAVPALRALGLHGSKSIDKAIPADYLRASVKDRLELLRGLMDTDGHQDPAHSGAEFATSSEVLARQVQWLIESLGGTATLSSKPEPTYTHGGQQRIGHPAWRLYIVMPLGSCPFWLARKAEAWHGANDGRQRPQVRRVITGVVPDGDGEAVCIAVDHPDHEFLTRHHVPTHNTRSALIVAEVLAEGGDILVIDTERESALTYADDFAFTHLGWAAPYNPRELAEVVAEAGNKYQVVIVDSLTHFWRGDGGTLDIAGGKFSGWKDARPAQIDLVEALLDCQAHFIGCARAKVEHVQEIENGRHVVRKLGMAVVQDDDLEYELNVAIEMDMDHSMTISKSRTTAVPVGRNFKAGHAQDFAQLYSEWLKGGEPPAPQVEVDALKARIEALPDLARKACKQEFVAQLGRPDHLTADKLRAAEVLVAGFEAPPDSPPDGGGKVSPSVPAADGDGSASPDASTSPPGGVGGAEPTSDDPPAAPAPEPTVDPAPASEPEPAPEPEPAVATADRGDGPPDPSFIKTAAKKFTALWPCEDAPRGHKTRQQQRIRYTFTLGNTGGRTAHLDELTQREAVKLLAVLDDVDAGRVTVDVSGEDFMRATFNGKTVELPWQDPDQIRAGRDTSTVDAAA